MSVFKWSQTPGSNDDIDSTINLQEGQSPGSLNNSARAMMAAIAKYRDDVSGNLVTGGTSTAYTLTTNQTFTALTDGISVTCRMSATNGASPTLNVDSLGAKAIASVYGTAMPTGALLSGSVQKFTYDSTDDKWIVQGQVGSTQPLVAGGTGASLTDPNADRILFWDDSEGAATWLAPSTGLAISGTNISLSHLGLEALTDPNADKVLFWDDSGGATAFATLGDGIETSGTTLQANIASQAEMETGTATDVLVPIGRQKYHPLHPKVAASIEQVGTHSVVAGTGVSSVTDNGTGQSTLTFATAFSDTTYQWVASTRDSDDASAADALVSCALSETKSATQLKLDVTHGATNTDSPELNVIICGDQ